MVVYTCREYSEMIRLYCVSSSNAAQAARAYGEEHPNAVHKPTAKTILHAWLRLVECGCVLPNRHENGPEPRVLTVKKEEKVLDLFHQDGTQSIRDVARKTNISARSVGRVLKKEKLHPYHYSRVQELRETDQPARVTFCKWILDNEARAPGFVKNIMFTDEATFQRNGFSNQHNNHMWGYENPFLVDDTKSVQVRFKRNVWAGIIGDKTIGPHRIAGTLNSAIYHRFVGHRLWPLCRRARIPRMTFEEMWFQHDGAPAHTSRQSTNYLLRRFPGRFIGKRGDVNWPPRSPDLNPLDYFLWGHIKTLVYKTPPQNIEELDEKIDRAFQSLTPAMISRSTENLLKRARCCIMMNGGHFEHMLHVIE